MKTSAEVTVYVVGAGTGDIDLLTERGRRVLSESGAVITTERLFAKMGNLNPNTFVMGINDFIPFIRENRDRFRNICVLVSGDVGFYSAAEKIAKGPDGINIEFISGISSMQYLTARLKKPYSDMAFLSAHGRDTNVIPYVCYNREVFVLTGGKNRVQDIVKKLIDAGLEDVTVTVGENLSEDGERIITARAADLMDANFGDLSVMLIENPAAVNPFERIRDDHFIRGKTPMTKEPIRTLSVSALEINPSDTVADIGAGTGAVSIEMARRAHRGTVYAIEREANAVALIRKNIKKFGAHNIVVIEGSAPESLEALPPVQKAFIGGSGGNLSGIVASLLAKNKLVKIAVNAITLETLKEAIEVFENNGIEAEIGCINASRAEKIGGYNLMKADNPIYIISGAVK
ncbi:MAG: precorrin-6y C5,15-methyltransferase (decarboxylating) subunit CbiE [Synergistaceae bacterium]|nr:precorrin-6y C5,15-methyltransferase (decarboxylating) subunit CbiE [Synergistaceae bacterium]MBP9957515.1 precorrin-6y C5,15-methyltransferase (decarboxylating) subunit CbiE [Synergistaceae bacterium]